MRSRSCQTAQDSMCVFAPGVTAACLQVHIATGHSSVVLLRSFHGTVAITNRPKVKSFPVKYIICKHFTCNIWISLLRSLSATASNMTVRVRVEAKLQCLGASNLEAGLLSMSFMLYLFPSFQTGPELDGNSKAYSKSTDCTGEARFLFYLSACILCKLLSTNECVEHCKWIIKF